MQERTAASRANQLMGLQLCSPTALMRRHSTHAETALGCMPAAPACCSQRALAPYARGFGSIMLCAASAEQALQTVYQQINLLPFPIQAA